MAYGTTNGTAAMCMNLLDGGTDFTGSTNPTANQVEFWLSSACSVIESNLSSWGYSVPPSRNAGIYDWLVDLSNLFAASRAELSRTNITVGPGERTRGQVFEQMFWDGLKRLKDTDLTEVGLSRRSGDKIYVGGTSIDAKDTWDEDTDRVRPRFFRGIFKHPESVYPGSISASSV